MLENFCANVLKELTSQMMQLKKAKISCHGNSYSTAAAGRVTDGTKTTVAVTCY